MEQPSAVAREPRPVGGTAQPNPPSQQPTQAAWPTSSSSFWCRRRSPLRDRDRLRPSRLRLRLRRRPSSKRRRSSNRTPGSPGPPYLRQRRCRAGSEGAINTAAHQGWLQLAKASSQAPAASPPLPAIPPASPPAPPGVGPPVVSASAVQVWTVATTRWQRRTVSAVMPPGR